MAKTTIDELLQAIETVQILQQTIGRHEQAIAKLLDRVERIEQRLEIGPVPKQP